MNRFSNIALLAAVVGGAFASSQANAAGFEKANMWGAREVGSASIAAPYVSGSNAIYFNPAGLVTDKDSNTFNADLSLVSSQFSAPINSSNEVVTTDRALTTPFGITYGHSAEKMGYGFGVFVSGGNNIDYKEVSYATGGAGYRPSVKSAIQIIEASAGAAYKVSDDLKVGLAWRAVMVNADFSSITRATGSPTLVSANAKLTNLTDTQYLAFRAGAQYKVNESTDLALTFRSEVNADPKGKAQVTTFSAANGAVASSGAEQDATAHTTFPMMIALSGLHRLNADWDLLAQYDFSQYSRVGEIVIDSSAFATTGNRTRVTTNYYDQHGFRLGAEYKSEWPIRFGVLYGNAVTNSDWASATASGPGPGIAVTLGTGKALGGADAGTSNMRVDGALEWSSAVGDATNGRAAGDASPAANSSVRQGTYSSSAYTLHMSFAYDF